MIGITDPIRFLLDFTALFAVYLMLSVSLNLEYGYTGLPNFGKVLFFAGGAFVAGGVTARLVAPWAGINLAEINYSIENVKVAIEISKYFAKNPGVAIGVFALIILLSIVVGAILGYIASYPAIRLREDYLGITLLAGGELLRIIARNYEPLICGTLGVTIPNPFSWMGIRTQELAQIALMLSAAILVWAFVERLARSPFGRVIRAVRDSEVAAAAMGKDVVRARMTSLVIGSAIAGLAGALYAFYTGAVHADDYVPIRTFLVWVMVIVGGAGNNSGAALGALAYVTMDRLIAQYKHYLAVPFDVNYLSYVFLGVLLILILMYRPEGILPEKPSRTLDFEKIFRRIEGVKEEGKLDKLLQKLKKLKKR